MTNYIALFRAWLELNVHPHAFWFLLTAISFGAVWLVRKKLPALWLWFESFGPENATLARVFEALPATLLGALLGVAATADPTAALKGALFGAFAPIWHHIMKKYRGDVALPAVKRIVLPPTVLLLVACGGSPVPTMPSDACGDEYAKIVAEYSAELSNACLGSEDPDCTDKQPAADKRYDAAIDSWSERCVK